MTTKTPQELAASLRKIHGARRHHSYTGHGQPVFAIHGYDERLADLELAAQALEDLAGANSMLNAVLGEWLEKTSWVQDESSAGKLPAGMLGMHRADVMTREIERLRAERSTAYQKGFTDRVASTEKMQLLEDFQRECDAADDLLRMLGVDPMQVRGEGGTLNMAKVRARLPVPHPADQLREAALAELDDWTKAHRCTQEPASIAIKCLCKRLGVVL